MAFADLSFDHGILERLRRAQCPQNVGHRRPGLPESLRELLLREVVRFHQELVSARRLDRVQIAALEVLDERELETVTHLVADYGRNRRPAGEPRGEDATVAS